MNQKALEGDLCALSVSGRLCSPPDARRRDIHLLKSSSILGNNKGKLFLNKTEGKGLIPDAGTQSQSSKTHRNLYEGKMKKVEKGQYMQLAAYPRLIQCLRKTPYAPKLHRKRKTFNKQW